MIKTSEVLLILFVSLAASADGPPKKSANLPKEKKGGSAAELLFEKHGSFRPKEVLKIRDTLKVEERVDLDNEYFFISYPKCFKAEPTPDPYEATTKNSASVDLIRTKNCHLYNPDSSVNLITIWNDLTFLEPDLIEKHEKASRAFYRQMIDVNGVPGVVYLSIGMPAINLSAPELRAGMTIELACKGKNNELIHIRFLVGRKDKAKEIVEKKLFDIPEDYKQIVGSFRCRKDR